MMGTKTRSFSPLPPDVSLEELVPEDHFYRRLEARLDFSFVRELVRPLYADNNAIGAFHAFVPDESVRGAHAHRACAQLLVCVAGAVSCVADDGRSRAGFRLSGPHVGLHLPAMTWGMQYRFTPDAVLAVLAELPYDPDDYIRDYEEFLDVVGSASAAAAAP